MHHDPSKSLLAHIDAGGRTVVTLAPRSATTDRWVHRGAEQLGKVLRGHDFAGASNDNVDPDIGIGSSHAL